MILKSLTYKPKPYQGVLLWSLFHRTAIKNNGVQLSFKNFRVNVIAWACFEGSRLKSIFH